MIPFKETIYSPVKRGIYATRRYPWGSNKGPGNPNPNVNGFIPAHYNFYTQANVGATALPRFDNRRFLQIQNMSAANDIVFGFGFTPSATDGVTLTPGQVEIFDVAVPIEELKIFCAASNQRVALIEGF